MHFLYIIVDVFFILASAIFAAFIWRHGRDIFNAPRRWDTFKEELRSFRPAYLIAGCCFVIMLVALFWRYQWSDEIAKKEDLLNTTTEIVNEIANNTQRIDELIDVVNSLTSEIRVDMENDSGE